MNLVYKLSLCHFFWYEPFSLFMELDLMKSGSSVWQLNVGANTNNWQWLINTVATPNSLKQELHVQYMKYM